MIVFLYTRPGCSACLATKRYLGKTAVPFNIVDTDEHPQAIEHLREKGFQELPVVEVLGTVDGVESESWSGYDPERLSALAERVASMLG